MATLFMLLIGCKPKGRHTEQHDVFFGVADSIKDLIPEVISFWPEAKGKLHIDAWRKVTNVTGFEVKVVQQNESATDNHLFFINLGGYKQDEFEEFHYKMIVAAANKNEAIKISKQTAFFKHTGFAGAPAHVDDKYGIDVDDVYSVQEILTAATKKKYSLSIQSITANLPEDKLHLGYFKLDAVGKWLARE